MSKIESFDVLIDKCKEDALVKLCGAFGIPNEWYEAKDGGNIATLHNAEKDIFPDEETRQNYEREYNSRLHHEGNKNYQAKKDENEQKSLNNQLVDDYTGRDISGKNFIVDKNGNTRDQPRAETEHFVASKAVHDNPKTKLYMNEKESTNLANSDVNLGATSKPINMSKSDTSYNEWADKSSTHDSNIKNAEAYGVKREDAEAKVKKAEKHIANELKKAELKHDITKIGSTGATEGLKMGLRAAMGKALAELGLAIFAEMKDIWKNGFTGDSANWLMAIKDRFNRILDKVKAKLEDVLIAFKDGAISGFLGNLVTFLINKVATTYQALVKAIRESFRELWRAIKLLIWLPKDMTFGEAILEVTKILTATVITGVMVWFQPQIFDFVSALPLIGTYAKEISFAIAGIASGTLSLVAAYLLDKFFAKHDYDKELFEKMTQNLEMQEQLSEQLTEQCHLNLQIAGVNEKIIISNEQILQDRWNLNRDTMELIEPVELFAVNNSDLQNVYAKVNQQLTDKINSINELNNVIKNLSV